MGHEEHDGAKKQSDQTTGHPFFVCFVFQVLLCVASALLHDKKPAVRLGQRFVRITGKHFFVCFVFQALLRFAFKLSGSQQPPQRIEQRAIAIGQSRRALQRLSHLRRARRAHFAFDLVKAQANRIEVEPAV